MTNKAIALTFIATMLTTPAVALELPKGAKKVSDADAIAIFVNRKHTLTLYDTKTGKKVGGGSLEHRSNGVKAVNITYKGKTIRKNLKWKINGGQLCAGSIAQGKTVCGTEGALYREGNKCYNSRDGRMVGTEFKC